MSVIVKAFVEELVPSTEDANAPRAARWTISLNCDLTLIPTTSSRVVGILGRKHWQSLVSPVITGAILLSQVE